MDVDSLSIEQTDENKSTNISEGNHEDSAEIPYHLFQFLSSTQCNMQSLCRICLSTDNKIMFPLYSTKELSMFACMFTTLTGIEINPDDGLPANVCKSCRTEIMSCYKFKIQCEKATKILISVLKCFTKVEPIGNNNSPEHDPEFHNTKVKKEFNILSSEGVENSNDINLNNIKNDICMLPNIVKRENCSEYVPEIHKTKARITKKKIGNSNAEDVEYLDDVISDDSYSLCMAPDVRKRKKRKVIISVTDSNTILNEIVAEKKSCKTSRQKIYSCKYCNKKFYNMKLLKAHLNNNHKKIQESELKFSCSHCKDAFSSEHDLKLHLILHSKGPIWTCSKCEKVFESKSLLRRHIYRHMESKRYSCDSCGKLFTELYALRRHSRVHTGEILEKKHECHLCDKKYSGSGLLAAHIARHEGRRPYVCLVCGKAFPSRRLLLSHSLTHSDNKPYACSYCDKRFRHESTRNTHHRTHTGEKPYICSTCGKTFIQNSNLKLHMRVHTGEKPYSCSTCNRKFSSGSSLKMHERTHTGERPYECKICKKTFARMNMKAHMLIHTGERPYTCTMCPKKFVNAARLRDHSRVHTGEKPFDCESCSQKFPTKSHLLRHMKTHIRDNTSTEQDCETIVFDIEEVPIEVTEELVLQDKNDVKTEMLVIDGSHDYQTQNLLNANGVIVNDINYANNVVAVKEGDVGVATSEADLEGATVKLYQLDQSLLQIHSSGGQLTIRKITSKMTANF